MGFSTSVAPELSSSPFCSAQECQGGKKSAPTLTYTRRRVGGLCVTAHGGGAPGEFTLLGNHTPVAEGGVCPISHHALSCLSPLLRAYPSCLISTSCHPLSSLFFSGPRSPSSHPLLYTKASKTNDKQCWVLQGKWIHLDGGMKTN